MNKGNVLVIDFDYFFPDLMGATDPESRKQWALYDWGHREAPFFVDAVWTSRAAGFRLANLDLPMLTGEQIGFWDRFRFRRNTPLFYHDSNAAALCKQVSSKRAESIWLYDAHHDAGYSGFEKPETVMRVLEKGLYECGNWMLWYWATGAELHVRYPTWKTWAFEQESRPEEWLNSRFKSGIDRQFDDLKPNPTIFDRVFVCRSGAWVPSWVEEHFWQFIKDAPFKIKADLAFEYGDFPTRYRDFDQTLVEQYVEQSRKARETAEFLWKNPPEQPENSSTDAAPTEIRLLQV
jgi:hypothetical protein